MKKTGLVKQLRFDPTKGQKFEEDDDSREDEDEDFDEDFDEDLDDDFDEEFREEFREDFGEIDYEYQRMLLMIAAERRI